LDKDAMKKDGMKKDSMQTTGIKKDSMTKDDMSKDGSKTDMMKKDGDGPCDIRCDRGLLRGADGSLLRSYGNAAGN
jgi:hypothetical protein